MQKIKRYPQARFDVKVLQDATRALLPSDAEEGKLRRRTMNVEVDGAEWRHDDPNEFFADYRRSDGGTHYWVEYESRELDVIVIDVWRTLTTVSVQGPDRGTILTTVSVQGPDRGTIERVFEIFESALEQSRVPERPKAKPTVFIGHGHSQAWRDLKDHLRDKHGYPVISFETGARAGHAIRDVLENMLSSSDFAVLVMTGEDEIIDGRVRARQNVVHEAGLFQGRLGFTRAIALVEEEVETFSNIEGIAQIRFKPGSIQSTFGDVLATLKREFG